MSGSFVAGLVDGLSKNEWWMIVGRHQGLCGLWIAEKAAAVAMNKSAKTFQRDMQYCQLRKVKGSLKVRYGYRYSFYYHLRWCPRSHCPTGLVNTRNMAQRDMPMDPLRQLHCRREADENESSSSSSDMEHEQPQSGLKHEQPQNEHIEIGLANNAESCSNGLESLLAAVSGLEKMFSSSKELVFTFENYPKQSNIPITPVELPTAGGDEKKIVFKNGLPRTKKQKVEHVDM